MSRTRVSPLRVLPVGVLLVAVIGTSCGSDDPAGDTLPDATEPETAQTDTTRGTTIAPDREPPEPTPSDTTGPETSQPAVTEPGTAVSAPEVITDDGEGHYFLGHEWPVSLRLSSDWAWDAPTLDGTGLTLTPVDYLVDPGYVEWLLEPAGPGVVTLSVVGSPNCGDAASCPSRTVTFQFDVAG